MALRNLNDFRASINNDGFLKSNKYLATITWPGNDHYMKSRLGSIIESDQNIFTIRCDSVQLPGVSFASADGPPRLGYGPMEKRPYAAMFDDITLTFIVDSDSKVHKMMYDWVNCIVNFQGLGGTSIRNNNGPAASSQSSAYEVGYRDRYAATLGIEIYQAESEKTMLITAYNAFPMGFPSNVMDWELHEPMKLTIPFAYTDYSVSYPRLTNRK